MCYTLYLSTSSGEDLTRFNSERVRFERLTDKEEAWTDILKSSHRWLVSGQTGCSCAFRHLTGEELVFDEPQD